MDGMAPDCGAFDETVVFLRYFKDLPDTRQAGKVIYPLDEVLLLSLLAVLAGAETIVDIARFGERKLDLLRRFRPFLGGTPAHDHLGDILATLDAEHFQRCFVAWVSSLTGASAEVIAIDGKTVRRSFEKMRGKAAIHMVSAFAARQRLVLGQVKVADKANEIVALPKLLDMLAIEGAIVTIPRVLPSASPRTGFAMGCQRAIARKIVDRKADYVLALKGNQGALREDVELFAAEQKAKDFKDTTISRDETVDGDHGRIEPGPPPSSRTSHGSSNATTGPASKRSSWSRARARSVTRPSAKPASTSPQRLCPPTRWEPSSEAIGPWRTACTGSWTWSSAMTNAGSVPITLQPTSPHSSTWHTTLSERHPAKIPYASDANSPHGMMSSSHPSSHDEPFTRFP